MQRYFDKVRLFCDGWKLVINFQKYEIILFKTPLYMAMRDTRKNWLKLDIINPLGRPSGVRSVVRYLGIWLEPTKAFAAVEDCFSLFEYGCLLLFNVSPFRMEKMTLFERQCVRTCLSLYRTPESEYKMYYPNEENLNRIHNLIINWSVVILHELFYFPEYQIIFYLNLGKYLSKETKVQATVKE